MIDNETWVPGVPVKRVMARYRKSPGKELEAKFWNPESSANLVANAFGWFMKRPSLLPPLPGSKQFGPADDVCVERCMRFPWRGGLHPWLDVVIETRKALIGIESKRYEPFRPKASGAAPWSEAYKRDVWGSGMTGFQRMRDLLESGRQSFAHLNATQLVKHALGLRTQAARSGRKPVLLYLYAEPRKWPDNRALNAAHVRKHGGEIAAFARVVRGDDVEFHSASYAQLLAGWAASPSGELKAHAMAVSRRYDLGTESAHARSN